MHRRRQERVTELLHEKGKKIRIEEDNKGLSSHWMKKKEKKENREGLLNYCKKKRRKISTENDSKGLASYWI